MNKNVLEKLQWGGGDGGGTILDAVTVNKVNFLQGF